MVTKMGISEKRAMEISGHLTRSMFDRYDIVALGDIKESGEKGDKWVSAQRSKTASVTSIGKRRKRREAA
jgi:hypothetical protein